MITDIYDIMVNEEYISVFDIGKKGKTVRI